jgi:hypothetical protein
MVPSIAREAERVVPIGSTGPTESFAMDEPKKKI